MEQRRTFFDWPLVRILPPAWCMATIWWMSDKSALPQMPGFAQEVWSYLGHFSMFGLLGLCVWWALGMNPRLLDRERNWYAIGIATAYGALDEFHQSFVPGRDTSGFDLLADFLGATVAVMLVPRLINRFTR